MKHGPYCIYCTSLFRFFWLSLLPPFLCLQNACPPFLLAILCGCRVGYCVLCNVWCGVRLVRYKKPWFDETLNFGNTSVFARQGRQQHQHQR